MKKRYYYKHRYFHKKKKKKDNISIENEILENRNNISYENIEVIDTNVNKKSFSKRFKDLKIKYKKDPKKFVVVVSSFLLVMCLLISGSFATLSYLSKTESTTKIESGTLALEIKNENNFITLDKAIPQEDKEALENNNEYLFTVENTGTLPSNYEIILNNTCELNKTYEINNEEITPDKCIPNEYIKVGLKEGDREYKVLEYDEEKEKYILETGILESSEIRNYKMKIWLDYDTPNEYNSEGLYNVIYSGKLGIEYKQKVSEDDNISYIVKYHSNTGTGEMEDSVFLSNEESTLSKNLFTKEDYRFLGWSTEENKDVVYQDEEEVYRLSDTENDIINLYAVWQKIINYQIVYNANGGEGEEYSTSHEDGELIKLQNKYTKEHYNFLGWSTTEDGEVEFTSEEEVTDLTTKDNQVITLYAVWEKKNYIVNILINNGTINGETSKEVTYNEIATFTGITKNTGYGGPIVNCTNGQNATLEGNTLTTEKISDNTTCTITYRENPTVSVTVTNGVVDGETSKKVEYYSDVIFNITPNEESIGIVSCTNNQTGVYENGVFTVLNVTSSTTCTVKLGTKVTTLYEDGTFIINEKITSRTTNISQHGNIIMQYEALSETQSYIFSENSSLWYNERNDITKIEIDDQIIPTSTSYWFYDLNYMQTGDFTNIDTQEVTDMSYMFYNVGNNATNLELVGIENWNTHNVENMAGMFYGSSVKELNLSSWDASKVTDMDIMFSQCNYLEKISFGEKCGGMGSKLPAPNSEYITGADGYWYDSLGQRYINTESETIPSNINVTYYAIKEQICHEHGHQDKDGDGFCDICGTVWENTKLESIAVTQQPTKIQYNIGEPFDPTGMVITASYTDGTTKTITDYTYSPKNNIALKESDTKITISYTEDDITKTCVQPIEVGYIITITGNGQDDSLIEDPILASVIINDIEYSSSSSILVSPGTNITLSASQITIDENYGSNEYSHTVNSAMTIHLYTEDMAGGDDGVIFAVSAVDFIISPPTVGTQPLDGTFDPTGMIITHTNADGTIEIVTDYTYVSETGGDTLTLSDDYVTISYTRDGNTYQTNLPISVKSSSSGCFAEGTLITLADGSQKSIEDITYEDELLVWDFYSGKYTSTVASLIEEEPKASNHRVLNLQFEDKTIVRIIDHHGFFDKDENDFVFIDETNVESFIGHEFVHVNSDGTYNNVKLIDYSITKEKVKFYTILTAVHSNCIAENILTLTPPPIGLTGWFDIFEIGNDMKYDEEKMHSAIKEYGIYSYSDFEKYITYEQFIAFNGPYLKILVGREVITYEQILEAISAYAKIIGASQ